MKFYYKFFSVFILFLTSILFINIGTLTTYEITYNSNIAVPISSLINQATNTVTVDLNTVAYIDQSIDVKSITVNGELHCDHQATPYNTEVKTDSLVISGVFQCGTKTTPYSKNLTISLKHNANLDPKTTPLYRGIIVHMGGKLILTGKRQKSGWKKLGVTAMPGDNFFVLASNNIIAQPEPVDDVIKSSETYSVPTRLSKSKLYRTKILEDQIESKFIKPYSYLPKTNWKIGDKIVIAPTGYNYTEAESFTITSIDANNPDKFYIDGTIQHQHCGDTQEFFSRAMGKVILDERAEVANLTRNIKIQGDESLGAIGEGTGAWDQRGGHIMVHSNGKAYIDSIELYKMGQAGVMARYPFHWHWIQDAPGQFIKNSSIHNSFQRCITVHKTNKALVHNNVCYDFKGHGYFLEDGTEIDNTIVKNLAILAKPPSSGKVLLDSDNINTDETSGRFPSVSCFWISNPDNIVSHNVAAGCHGTGFWNSFEAEVKDGNGNVVATPILADTKIFNYNIAHACEVGMTWDGAPIGGHTNNPNNPNDRKIQAIRYKPQSTPVFRGLRAYKNFKTGIYFRAETTILKYNVVADNGWSYWNGYNQVITDSVIIGKTDNYSPQMADFFFAQDRTNRFTRTGVVLYDGPFEVHKTDFLNFSTSHEEYTKPNGQKIHSTAIPFTNTGGSSKYLNFVSRLNFEPDPVYRIFLNNEDVWRERQFLGNSVIRDLDGTLSGTNKEQVITAKRSMGVTNNSGCYVADNELHNYKVCPANYTEGSFVYMRWGGYASPWGTPFIAMRSDGVVNYPKNEWTYVSYMANNLFATVNNSSYTYKLLPKYNYYEDRNIYNTRPAINGNLEKLNSVMPVVEIVGYGKNCYLNKGAIQKNSLNELKNATSTAYYSHDEKFYVKLVPDTLWPPIIPSSLQMATAYDTVDRHAIFCDDDPIEPYVKGRITKVQRSETETTIKGWACNFTYNTSINVKLYAYGPPVLVEPVVDPTNLRQASSRGKRLVKPFNSYFLLANQFANKASDEKTTFECGKFNNFGRNFEIKIKNDDLKKYTKHKFYVKGISNSGGQDSFITGSGLYPVMYRKSAPYPQDKQSVSSY